MSKIHEAMKMAEAENAITEVAPSELKPAVFLPPNEETSGPVAVDTAMPAAESDPRFRVIEEVVRTLRANLLVRMRDQRVLLVASARPCEGKSTIVALLARSTAALRRVLVIDADLRRPRVSSMLGCAPGKGVAEVAAGANPESLIQVVHGLSVLPPGACDADPQRRLGSEAFCRAMQYFRSRYDLILIDTPPVLACADAVVLAPLADGALLVARAGEVLISELVETRRRLESGGAKVLGGIINGVNNSVDSPTAPYSNYVREVVPSGQHETATLFSYGKAAGAKG